MYTINSLNVFLFVRFENVQFILNLFYFFIDFFDFYSADQSWADLFIFRNRLQYYATSICIYVDKVALLELFFNVMLGLRFFIILGNF